VNEYRPGFAGTRTSLLRSALLAFAGWISLSNAGLAAPLQPDTSAQPAQGAPADSRGDTVIVIAMSAHLQGTGAGTVVLVSGEHVRIVTAKHVAEFGSLSVRFAEEGDVPARIVALIPNQDVAVIEAVMPPSEAARLQAAKLGTARPRETVVVRGAQPDGRPDVEAAAVERTDEPMPGAVTRGGYGLACDLCHHGDSGAGVFNAAGALIGVYIGFWTYDSGERVGLAELPTSAVQAAASTPFSSSEYASLDESNGSLPVPKIARSNTSSAPVTAADPLGLAAPLSARKVASTRVIRADASGAGRTGEITLASDSAAR
jgi:hypothetical protein